MAPPENANSMQRVKVFRLNEAGGWDDLGTGHISVDYLERSEELGLYVIDELDNETLLLHRVTTENIYRKQEGRIISWRDPECSTELALSFQETAGCAYVWDQIYMIQQYLHFNYVTAETFHIGDSELRELPDVDVSTLPLILKIVTESDVTEQMQITELMLKDSDFFQKLMGVFEISEDSKNVDDLHMMFNIVKGIISFNSCQILEKILGDELIMKIIGCLEYDPDVPQSQHHRNYLKEHVFFKEVIPITDPLVLSKIHQTYRIEYLKDVVLTRVLDDATAAYLNSVINANKATVATRLKDDSTFFQELFARLRSPSTSVESRSNLVHFLHEFCSLSKSLPTAQQIRLFMELVHKGIFDIIAEVLGSSDKKIVLTGTDILLIILTHDPKLLRSYVVEQETPLLGLLVKGMMDDFGDKMHCQFVDIFRILLNSDGGAQRVNIMNIIFEKHIAELVDFITASCPERPGDTSEGASRRVGSHCGTKPQVLLNICEFLCICIQQDSSRKNFLHKGVMEKVLYLTQRKEKAVVAAAIRVCRTLLSVLDENVQIYVVEKNMLRPIIHVFVACGKRDNLVNSAVLELLEHIRKARATVMLKYVVDTFWDKLSPFEFLTSVKNFKTKYDQCLKSMGAKSTTDPVDVRRNERSLGKEEDNNGKENSDEEKSASASITGKEEANPHSSNVAATSSASSSPKSRGLVDYEDDEDLKPHPQKSQNSPCIENEQEQSKRQRL